MRSKDLNLMEGIRDYINDYCDRNGRGPSVGDVATKWQMSKSTAQSYLSALKRQGKITQSVFGYESVALAETRSTVSVPILGAIPCGPLTEAEEQIEGYLRLPESFVGKGRFYLLRTYGNSMIGAGINDGDLVLVRIQNNANVGEIIVALVNNEVTLKRLAYDEEQNTYYLHPENRRMKDIYPEEIAVQGIAVKVIKDLV